MAGQLLLVVGKPTSGKTFSLDGMREKEKIFYLNCEGSGKPLPISGRNKIKQQIILDPLEELLGEKNYIDQLVRNKDKANINTVVVDTITFLMDIVETKYVKTVDAKHTMQAWGFYGDFFRNFMGQVAKLLKVGIDVILMAHVAERFNGEEQVMDSYIPIKGAVGKTGVEAFFSDIVSTEHMKVKDLEGYENDYLHITEEEQEEGFKHVIQTRITKDTIGKRIRTNPAMWKKKETYIDGNIQVVLDRMKEFYGD